MSRMIRVWTVLAVALVLTALPPEAVAAANPYGQVFAGQEVCLSCHGDVGGLWQVATYPGTPHGRFVADVQAATSALVPARSSTLWPSPAIGGGFAIGPADVWLQLGAPGQSKEYVSVVRNDGSHTLSTGFTVAPVAGPPDDWWLFNNQTFLTAENAWEAVGPAGARAYFQTCGGCHNLGVTRPTDKTYTLANGAVVGHSTETSYAGLGIQCESCHGTGSTRSSHHKTGVEVVRTKQVLKSQACGQCHVSGTAKERNYSGGTFSSPNGFTTDRKLEDFFDVLGAQYVRRSPASPAPSIPATDAKFYPDGHNKSMHHSYYNEWMLSGHARSLHYPDGSLFSSHARDSCLGCHSGEGFLKRIGYGKDEPNDISIFPSTVASDTLNVECAVCHTVHATTGDALGLRLPEGELCQSCHNAEIAEGAEATPGTSPHHSQAEMIAGYGLIGVPKPAERFMGNADCVDCHMPETRESRVSHRFTPLLPGDAEAWNVREKGDSCTPCHASLDRGELQDEIDGWTSAIDAASAGASAALSAARSRADASSARGRLLIDSAGTNLMFVGSDSSRGVHNFPYAKAGLEKAAYFADAVGASLAFTTTSFDARSGLAFVYGKLAFGDGSVRAGESVTIEAKPGGATTWTAVGTVVTMASGDFSCAVGPNGTTEYRARWTPLPGAELVSAVAEITFGTSTSIRVSPARRRGSYVTVSGAVSPSHGGRAVTIQCRYGRYSWRNLSVRRLSNRSAYSCSFSPPARGKLYFRAVFDGDASHAGSVSAVAATRVY